MKEQIKKILDQYGLLRLATVTSDGFPKVRSVDFARDPQDESIVYFMTFKNTNKVKELAANPHVSLVVDQEADSMDELSKVLYLKANGLARLLETESEIQLAAGSIMTKYPYLSQLPGDPSMMNFYAIQMQEVQVTDNAQGFGHTETLRYQ